MSKPRMDLLRARDWKAALSAVGDIAADGGDAAQFARAGAQVLSALVSSDLTTLSRCDLIGGKRLVFGVPPGAIGADERAAFDRHFSAHPLVRYHAFERGPHVHRVTDSMTMSQFRCTPLFNDYYRRIGLSHAMALPVRMDGRELVSFVFNRAGHDFSERELAVLEALRRALAHLFLHAVAGQSGPALLDAQALARRGLTRREAQVLQWVAAGKTDRDTAMLLACSTRTVNKHLQRIYDKLGVETRMAAVMRALGRT